MASSMTSASGRTRRSWRSRGSSGASRRSSSGSFPFEWLQKQRNKTEGGGGGGIDNLSVRITMV